MVQYVNFTAGNSDSMSWFSYANVAGSSWVDIPKAAYLLKYVNERMRRVERGED
jgi:hypothetical protein